MLEQALADANTANAQDASAHPPPPQTAHTSTCHPNSAAGASVEHADHVDHVQDKAINRVPDTPTRHVDTPASHVEEMPMHVQDVQDMPMHTRHAHPADSGGGGMSRQQQSSSGGGGGGGGRAAEGRYQTATWKDVWV